MTPAWMAALLYAASAAAVLGGVYLATRRTFAERRRHIAALRAEAEQHGWRPMKRYGEQAPLPVRWAVQLPSTRLALTRQIRGAEVWVVWQHRVVPSATAQKRSVADTTRYFTAVPPGTPRIPEKESHTARPPRGFRAPSLSRPHGWYIGRGLLVLRFAAPFNPFAADGHARDVAKYARTLPGTIPRPSRPRRRP